MSAPEVLWVEKHRPRSLDDIIGHDNIVARMREWVTDERMPNLLFAGPQGTGKTAIVQAFSRERYGEDAWRNHVMQLNASDERGIDVVRDKIKTFARQSTAVDGGDRFKVVFLDEVDQMCFPAGTEVTVGYPSSPEVKPIEEVSEEGEAVPSVDFETNELQADRGRLLETGEADFYCVTFADGKEVVASPEHPFFRIGEDSRLIATPLRELSAGEEVADLADDIGVSQCPQCGEWSSGTYCSVLCKNVGHSEYMSGGDNPRYGVEVDENTRAKISASREGQFTNEDNPRYRDGRYTYRKKLGLHEKDEAECEVCGDVVKVGGQDGIYVHHRDGDRSNNDEKNLMAVCPRCHQNDVHQNAPIGGREITGEILIDDGGRREVDTVQVKSVEFDHHGKAYNITMDGTPNFMTGNGILTHNTSSAQPALRRIMEDYSDKTRFILSCNYLNQIIQPIQSRCAVFQVDSLEDKQIKELCEYVVEKEDIDVTEDIIWHIVETSKGDARRAINTLQAATVQGEITKDSVGAVSSVVSDSLIEELVDEAVQGEFETAMERLDREILKKGVDPQTVCDAFLRVVKNYDDLPPDAKIKAIDKVGECDWRILQGANPSIHFHKLLADIHISRHLSLDNYNKRSD